ncbi:MAG: hypothetical protein PHY80_01805, partial [Rickettsiales bacterium]|nr:hypothetical protein [Rickettsiales bacterium]
VAGPAPLDTAANAAGVVGTLLAQANIRDNFTALTDGADAAKLAVLHTNRAAINAALGANNIGGGISTPNDQKARAQAVNLLLASNVLPANAIVLINGLNDAQAQLITAHVAVAIQASIGAGATAANINAAVIAAQGAGITDANFAALINGLNAAQAQLITAPVAAAIQASIGAGATAANIHAAVIAAQNAGITDANFAALITGLDNAKVQLITVPVAAAIKKALSKTVKVEQIKTILIDATKKNKTSEIEKLVPLVIPLAPVGSSSHLVSHPSSAPVGSSSHLVSHPSSAPVSYTGAQLIEDELRNKVDIKGLREIAKKLTIEGDSIKGVRQALQDIMKSTAFTTPEEKTAAQARIIEIVVAREIFNGDEINKANAIIEKGSAKAELAVPDQRKFKREWVEKAPEEVRLPNRTPVSQFTFKGAELVGGDIVTTFGFSYKGEDHTFTIKNFTPEDLLLIREHGLTKWSTIGKGKDRCGPGIEIAKLYDAGNREPKIDLSGEIPTVVV